jgi:pimeloyl-ACP methyl ester carboxylesterase
MSRRKPLVLLLATCLALVACTGDHPDRSGDRSGSPTSAHPATPAPAAAPALTDPFGCGHGFTCATLRVPLDRADPAGGSLPLLVALEEQTAAPRGLLLVLAGGPGQAGVPLVERLVDTLGAGVVDDYRIALLDQRGTGATALRCPALQEAMGFSDLTPPPAAAVEACARAVGDDRELYSTDDVVADLDLLRIAVGADRMTLYGTSYGTFVAEQYALAHPRQVQALVLDSVVPHGGIDPLAVDVMHAVRRVLRAACAATSCPGDPVADLAAVVAREDNGVDLLDLTTMVSIVDPTFEDLFDALHQAAQGDAGALDGLLQGYRDGFQGPANELSQGLHASALCSDWSFPWGTSAAPQAGRAAALDEAVARLSATDLAPFDASTARGNGFVQQCLPWPPVPDAGLPRSGDLPEVPTLLLAGGRDLSTPLEWAEREAAQAPDGRLVVVPTSGHGVARRGGKGQAALQAFLLR